MNTTIGGDSLELKDAVRHFWEEASCGEVYAVGDSLRGQLEAQQKTRYELEPYIFDFARFHEAAGKDVLEIGVGMGADHLQWCQAGPKSLNGVDLTDRALAHTRTRLDLYGLESELAVADAENLPFDDESFDLVYSWGVLHHTPDTPRAINEVLRVLRTGGTARIMIYHSSSVVGYLLWARYALLTGRPRRTLKEVYSAHLESPGTKAYSVDEAKQMFAGFSRVDARVELSEGDLLQGAAGQRHQGTALSLARMLWPRRLIRRAFPGRGLFLLVEAVK